MNLLAIAIGGAFGAVCRHGANVACRSWLGVNFAYGTLAVNVLGCFLLGLLIPLGGTTSDEAARHGVSSLSPAVHSALTIGFLGALTTFSTFGFETVRHMEDAQHHLAATNVALNLVLGVAAVFAGLWLGRGWTG